MVTRVKITLDNTSMIRIVGGHARDAVRRAADVTRQRAQQNIRSLGRIDTGRMIGTLGIKESGGSSLHPYAIVGSEAPYVEYQEFGTRGSVARPGGVLVFRPKGSSALVFTKRTGPIAPGRFMLRSLTSLKASDFCP